MNPLLKQITGLLLVAGVYSASATIAAQVGPTIVPRNPNDPSIHEGVAGNGSAGFKTNIDPLIGRLRVSYPPFEGIGRAIGSLVQPFFHAAPALDNSAYGFKPTIQQMFPYSYSQKGGGSRLDEGFKGIAGKNVTDVASKGQRCGTGPGDVYWVGFPRKANPQQLPPPVFQQPDDPRDCACRCNEKIFCSTGFNPWIRYVGYGGWNPNAVACQVCFGPANLGFDAIVKHDIYVGTDHGTHNGYLSTFPTDPGYLQCLRENQGDRSGGSPTNNFYGL